MDLNYSNRQYRIVPTGTVDKGERKDKIIKYNAQFYNVTTAK